MKLSRLILLFFMTTLGLVSSLTFTNSEAFRIVAREEALVVKTGQSGIFLFGKKENAKEILDQLFPLPFQEKRTGSILSSFAQEKNLPNFSLQQLSPNFSLGVINEKKIAFFGNDFGERDKKAIVRSPYSLQADFWVFTKAVYPEFLLPPRKGILFLSKREPSKKLKTFCSKNNISLISTRETGGVNIKLTEGDWRLFVAK